MTSVFKRSGIGSSAIIIALFSILSRLMGVVRDRVLAGQFGAGDILDAYYAAFKLPDFIFTLLVLGALGAALIPVYVQVKQQGGREAAFALARRVALIVVMVLTVFAIVVAFLAPQLVSIIAPGFTGARAVLTIQLTRVMLFSTVVFGASNALGSILQAERRFVAFAAAPILYNAGIILGAWLLVPLWGPAGLGWGVVLGSILHLLIQQRAVRELGFSWFKGSWGDIRAAWKVFALMGGRTVGLAASAIEQVIINGFLSTLTVGSVAAFALAANLQSFPTNVFGVSLAIAAFPVFSEALGANNRVEFLQQFSTTMRRILFFVLPLAILFLVLRAHVVRVVLGSGAFDWDDTIRTAQMLGFLSVAMVADSVLPLIARVFYALGDTRTPAYTSIGVVILNVILLFAFRPWGLTGIGASYVISRTVNAGVLLGLLTRRIGGLNAGEILQAVQPMVLAACVGGLAAYGCLHLTASIFNLHTFAGVFMHGSLAGLVGAVVYFLITRYWRITEAEILYTRIRGLGNY